MIFKDFITVLGERVHRESQGGTFGDRVKRALNSAINFVSNVENQGRWRQKYMWRYTLTTTAAQNYIVMPLDFDSAMNVWHEQYTNEELMEIMSLKDFRSLDKNTSLTGNPERVAFAPSTGILAQPSSASQITVYSSSTTDKTQHISIYGISNGLPYNESVQLDNTGYALTTATFTRVDKVTKSASTVGRISVESNVGTVTVATMPAGLLSNSLEYTLMYMYPYSSTAISMYMDYFRKQYWLEDDFDVTLLGDDFDEAILLYGDWLLTQNEERLVQYKDMIKDLKSKYNFTPGAIYEKVPLNGRSIGGFHNYESGYFPRLRW